MIYIKCEDNPIRAKVWSVEQTEKYIDLQVSTSRKDKDGNYFYSRWLPRAIGHAVNSLKDVKEGDWINIKCAQITNESYVNKDGEKRYYFKIVITDAEIRKENTNSSSANPSAAPADEAPAPAAPTPATDEEDPW